ncbi:MAG: nucleoside recognition protein [Clostridia bacterium]|nr:nucleoside recognition protein [Clostridia bacterium]
MLDFVWLFLLLSGAIYGMVTGHPGDISQAILQGAGDGIQITIGLAGMFCLWSGLTEIASRAGILTWLSNLLWPVIHILMPNLPKDCDASRAISMNLVANMLGVGNAATPLGIKAVQELKIQERTGDTVSNSMIMFLLLNVAGLQLVPTMVLSIRQGCGATVASSVLPKIWVVQIVSLLCGIITCAICSCISSVSKARFHKKEALVCQA